MLTESFMFFFESKRIFLFGNSIRLIGCDFDFLREIWKNDLDF